MPVRITKPEINLREIINELDKKTGVAGQEILAADTPQEQFKLIGAGRRNILINGDFQVSQRGDFTTAADAGNAYYLDRWVVDRNGTCDLQHTTGHDIPGSPAICKAGKLTQTVAGNNYLGFRQKIEDPTRYVGRTITYSAWVRSNTSNARIEWYTQGTNQFAIGPNHSGNGDWEYLSFTTVMTGNPSTNWWIDVFIDNGAYSNVQINVGDFVEVTMAQLEIGPVATPFEHRSYGEELSLCKRYYQQYGFESGAPFRIMGAGNGSNSMLTGFQYEQQMRDVPNINYFGNNVDGGNFNVYVHNTAQGNTAPSASQIGTRSVRWNFSGNGSYPNGAYWIDVGIGTNQLAFTLDAEL